MNHLFKSTIALGALALTGLFTPSNAHAVTAANWISCANEGGMCVLHNSWDKIVTMRYGVPGKYHYTWVRNNYDNQLYCGHSTMGDPAPGSAKKCDYSTYNFYEIPNNDSQWNHLSSEGQWAITPGGDTQRWLRYGNHGRWVYTQVAPNQLITCDHHRLSNGEDPAYGTGKVCQYLQTAYDDTLGLGKNIDFVQCANEGQVCNLPSKRPTLVRYGAFDYTHGRDRYYSSIVTTDSFTCDNNFLAEDPAPGLAKYCQYLPLEYKTTTGGIAHGSWTAVADNGGSGNRTLSLEIWTGVVTTDTDSTSNDWSVSITNSIESGGLSMFGGGKVSASISAGFAHSSSTSTALTREQREKVTTSCSATGTGYYKMWRFETDISFKNCLSEGVCQFTVEPVSTFCSTTNQVPQCVPGYCAPGTNCQQCTY